MITVVIPHLPERKRMLERALESVDRQTLPPTRVIVETDYDRAGSWVTRNRAIDKVDTSLVAFLDDDDVLLPDHLRTLYTVMSLQPAADVVYSNYDTIGSPGHAASFIQITNLANVDAIRSVGGFPEPESGQWIYKYSDWGLWAKMLVAGYSFRKAHQTTWQYHIHQSNTVGIGDIDIERAN